MMGLGLFLVLTSFIALNVYTYTRAGEHGRVSAQASSTLNFQARLLTSSGAIVPDGNYSVEFNLYEDEFIGSSAWTETQTVTVKSGYLSAYLGDVTPFPAALDWSDQVWLTMNVEADGEMTPRIRLTAVPYAFQAGFASEALTANQADGITSGLDILGADDLLQKAPLELQSLNSSVAGLRFNQTGAGGLIQLQSDGVNRFVVSRSGDVTATSFSGNGAGLTLLSAANIASGELDDGRLSGNVALLDGAQTFSTRITFGSGLTLGNSSSTTSGTLRWSGADFEGYNGTEWISFTSGSGLGALVLGTFYAYESTGNVNLTGWTDLSLNTQVKADAQYTHTAGNAPVTLNNTGWYEITYNVSTYTTAGGNNQASAQAKLVEDTGGGFTDIPGSDGFMYLASGRSDSNASVTVLREFQAGDIVKLQAQQSAGTMTIQTSPNSVGLTIRYITEAGEGGGGTGLEFVQSGNSFGAKAILGTTDAQGLDIITNGSAALTFTSAGEATFTQGLSVSSGGLNITGDTVVDGTLSGLTGLTLVSGGIDLNASGMTNTGSITGVGSDITSVNGLNITSGSGGDLTLNSASGLLTLDASTWRRVASEQTSIQLNDGADTTLRLENTDGTAVANLNVEGLITATNFSGLGTSLTGLNASNISSGTLDDSLLSSNIARLDTAQTFTSLSSFSGGLVLGNTASATTGAIRWNGADFEGYNGTEWVSLTSGSGGGASLLEGVLAFGKIAANGSTLSIDGASVTRNATGDYTVTLSSAASSADYITQLTLDDSSVNLDNITISIANQTSTTFDVYIRQVDTTSGGSALVDAVWHFIAFDETASAGGGSSGPSGLEFTQGGNSFGTTALLGTTDSQALSFVTSGVVALSIDALGDAVFNGALTVTDNLLVSGTGTFEGGLVTIGTSSQTGELALRDGFGNTARILAGTLTQDRTFTFPNASGEICVSSGNCSSGVSYVEIGGNTTLGALVLGTNNAQEVSIKTNNTNQLTIDTSGNINILNGALRTAGTTRLSNSGVLQNITGLTIVSGGANITGGISIAGGATVSSGGIAVTGNSTVIGTFTSSSTLTVNANGAVISGGINNNTGGITNTGALSGVTTLTATGNINTSGGAIQTAGVTRISNTGNLLNIGTLTASGAISSNIGFTANGAAGISGSCSGNNDYLVNFTITGGIVTAGQCRQSGGLSDLRLKENIVSLDSSILEGVSLINTVNFDFKCEDPAYAELNLDCERQTGVIAQELAEIFPELVYQGADGYYRVRYDALNIYTLKAVGELAKTVDSAGNVSAETIKTDNTVRLSSNGQLQNINGLSLVSGGASIVGGIDNNLGGLYNVGDIDGVQRLFAREIRLTSSQDSEKPFVIEKDDNDVFTIFNNGALELTLDSQNAFAIKDSQSNDVFRVNSKDGLVYIGGNVEQAKTVLFVLSGRESADDPVGVNGAQYYNNAIDRFRCYQDNRWIDCVPSAVTEYVVAPSTLSWVVDEDQAEIPGSPRIWVDMTSVREIRLQLRVNQSASEGAVCLVEYALDESGQWNILAEGATIVIDEVGTIRSDWAILPDEAREEVIVRVVCESGDGVTQTQIDTVRMQVR